LELFKVQHGNKSFTLTHCWNIISKLPKFREQYAAQKKNGGPSAVVDHGDPEKRPRGQKNSKLEDKREATTLALQETLKGLATSKLAREEKKRLEKEEQMKAYLEIQKKKIEIEEKQVKLAVMTKQMEIMMVDLNTVSPRKRAWFEKMQNEMLASDD